MKDIATKNIENRLDILKNNFPECFDREGNLIINKLQEIINPDKKAFRDSYGLNWLGKSYAKHLVNVPINSVLEEDEEHNRLPENERSENLYIKGDNLEVIKHLINAYSGEIKMIYIDPPYNTKSGEFIYKDDRKFSENELNELFEKGIIDEVEKDDILKWSDKGSSSHSAWLTFMYPRLYLARKLLKSDGIIFISIDDNEVNQLKLMCDEIFGEENFRGNIVRSTGQTTGQDSGGLGSSFDYVLVYTRNSEISLGGLSLDEDDLKRFENEDERGKFAYDQMRKTGSSDKRSDRPNMYYPVINPDGEEVFPIGPTGYESRWRFEKKTYEKFLKENYIIWKKTKRGENEIWWPYVKYYLEGRTKRPSPLWIKLDGNKKASRDLRELFDGEKVFDFPKPLDLLKQLMQIVPELCEGDIVLDFFSGSASTAHGVLEFNDKNKKNVFKYIMVQIPEKIEDKVEISKLGYNNICDIGIERIKRAAKLIENKENIDYGFKIYSIREIPNKLLVEKEFNPNQQIFMKTESILEEKEKNSLLHTFKVYDGKMLTETIKEVAFDNYKGYLIGDVLYFMDAIDSSNVIKHLLEKIDNDKDFIIKKVVVYGYTNQSAQYRKELIENVKNYNNKKSANIDIEVRY